MSDENQVPEVDLKQLAMDVEDGRVFTSNHCKDFQEIAASFVPITLMSNEQLDAFIAAKPALIYQYLTEAGIRGINGRPMFLSLKYIVVSQMEEFEGYLLAYRALKAKFAEDSGVQQET